MSVIMFMTLHSLGGTRNSDLRYPTKNCGSLVVLSRAEEKRAVFCEAMSRMRVGEQLARERPVLSTRFPGSIAQRATQRHPCFHELFP